MKHNKNYAWFLLLAVLLTSLACALPFANSNDKPAAQASATGTEELRVGISSLPPSSTPTVPPATVTPTPLPPTATVKPTAKLPNANPLPLRQGLASLNSYRLKIHVVTNGPTKADKNENNFLVESNTKTSSSHTHIESISSSADEPTPSSNTSDQYTVGKQSCQVSGGKSTPTGELTEDDPMAKDIANTLSSLLDYNLYVENPAFIAQENLNGVAVNHFSFKVTQLGKDSGMVVNQNSGEYWVAKDGQYLVKYSVILELSSDKAGTKLVHSEIALELSSINQPVDIKMPANCVKK
jgi:hypothetical protein